MTSWADVLQSFAAAGTSIGVGFAGWQLLLAHRQAVTTFEDAVAREYRSIAQRLPVTALLGEALQGDEFTRALDEFYHYIDLSNEQAFLRARRRISRATWLNWRDGIQSNLAKPAFRAAWEHIQARAPGSFQELRRLERERFSVDPVAWGHSQGDLLPEPA